MDACINTKVLSEMASGINDCKAKLEQCIITIKAEFKVADALIDGEQFEIFKNGALSTCESINATIDGLIRAKTFISELEPVIVGYDGTKY